MALLLSVFSHPTYESAAAALVLLPYYGMPAIAMIVTALEALLCLAAGIDAPKLGGILAQSLMYANDLVLMSTTPEGLQQQLDALASFCEQRQLTVNFSKAKVVIFEALKSDCKEFVFSGTTVKRHDEYRHFGFVLHATKYMAYGVECLVAAGKNTVLHLSTSV